MSDPNVTRAELNAEAELERRQVLGLVEIWENDDRGRYYAFVPNEGTPNRGKLHELGAKDFEESAHDLEEALLFRELFQLLPAARQTYFQAVINRNFRRALRRRGITVAEAVGSASGAARTSP